MCSDPVAANSSTARAPSIGPQRNSLNRKIDGSRRSSSADFCENEMVAAAGHALCRFARARLGSPAPRDKDHDRASRKCRSESMTYVPSAQLLNRGAVVDDPVAPQRPQRRSPRSPELQRRPPNRNITKKEAGAPPRRPAQVEMRRARLFGEPRQGIKNTIRQPEMSERESTPLPPGPCAGGRRRCAATR